MSPNLTGQASGHGPTGSGRQYPGGVRRAVPGCHIPYGVPMGGI